MLRDATDSDVMTLGQILGVMVSCLDQENWVAKRKVLHTMQREEIKTKGSQSFCPFKHKFKPREQTKFKTRWTKTKGFYKGKPFAKANKNNKCSTSSKTGQ